MTPPELARLGAKMDRLWLGAKVGQALHDRATFDDWLRVLGQADFDAACEALDGLNRESAFAPTPGMIAQRAEEIAAARRPALAPPDILRDPTPEELALAAKYGPELRRRVANLAAGRSMRVPGAH